MLQRYQTLTGLPEDLAWSKYCGFLDLSASDFLKFQEQRLLGYLPQLAWSGVGSHLLNGRIPTSLQQFRRWAPLTTYEDYAAFLKPEEAVGLPEPPVLWAHAVRPGAELAYIPYPQTAIDYLVESAVSLFLLASGGRLEPEDRVLFSLAPKPYLTGFIAERLVDRLHLQSIMGQSETDGLDFPVGIAEGFTRALGTGVDVVVGLTSVLQKMAEGFQAEAPRHRRLRDLARPVVAWRILRAWFLSKLAGRPILPKDLWPVKALICWGMDTDLYRRQLREAWGCDPYQFAATTEAGIFAVQVPGGSGLTFLPTPNFLEFLPEEEAFRATQAPATCEPLLIDQLEPGKRYEVVITSCNGMPFLRYRLGHMVEVLPPVGGEAHGQLPLVRLAGRADPLIDLGGFTRLDEQTLSRALVGTGVPLRDWIARRELEEGAPILKVYLEPMNGYPEDMEEHLHRSLVHHDRFYRDMDQMLGLRPVRITPLAHGAFQRYYERERGSGAAVHHFVRVNPSDAEIQMLLACSGGATPEG